MSDELASTVSGDDVRCLADLGFMAIMRGAPDIAATLFSGVVAARPSQEAGHIGLAMVHLHQNEVAAAVGVLRSLAPSDPVRLFLGMALARQGDVGEARAVLSELVASAAGTPPAESAAAILAAFDG